MEKLNVFVTCGMSIPDREKLIFSQFLSYGKMQARFIAGVHDMSADYCARYIASGLYDRFLKMRSEKIADYGMHYNSVDYETFCHVMALVKKIKTNLNFSCGGYYEIMRAHSVTLESGIYMGNKDYMNIGSKNVLHRENMSTHNIDIVDIIEQWENRDARSAQKYNKRARCFIDDDGIEVNELDRISGNYETPESALQHDCALLLARRHVSRIACNYRNFENVYNVLVNGEKTSADKMTIKRFKDRNNLSALSLDDLKYLFAY